MAQLPRHLSKAVHMDAVKTLATLEAERQARTADRVARHLGNQARQPITEELPADSGTIESDGST